MAYVTYYEGGGYAVHKAQCPGSPCRFSAYFTPEGKLRDAERITRNGVSQKASARQWQFLARLYEGGKPD